MRKSEARAILELAPDASFDDARKAYRRLLLTEHPDKSKHPDANQRFQRIQDAYTCLQAADESGRFDDDDDYDEDDEEEVIVYDDDDELVSDLLERMFGFGGPRTPGGFPSGFVFTGLAGHDGSFSFEREADGRHRREHTSRTEHIHQEEHWRRAQEAQREEMRRAQQQVQRQFEQARQRCAQKASEAAEPTRADQLRQRGNQAFAAGRYAKAVTQYSAALKAMAPTRNPRLLSNRSASYAKLERFEEAYKDAVECAKLSPDWDKAHGRLGVALAGLGKHEAAAEAFDQAAAACIASTELHGQTGGSESEGAPLAAEVAKATAEWRERARQQRVQAETEAQREREKVHAEAAAVAKRREESKRREAQIETRKAEVEHELRHAVDEGLARIEGLQRLSAGDSAGSSSGRQLPLALEALEEHEEVIKRVLTSAQRVGVCKEVQAHAIEAAPALHASAHHGAIPSPQAHAKGALKRMLCMQVLTTAPALPHRCKRTPRGRSSACSAHVKTRGGAQRSTKPRASLPLSCRRCSMTTSVRARG